MRLPVLRGSQSWLAVFRHRPASSHARARRHARLDLGSSRRTARNSNLPARSASPSVQLHVPAHGSCACRVGHSDAAWPGPARLITFWSWQNREVCTPSRRRYASRHQADRASTTALPSVYAANCPAAHAPPLALLLCGPIHSRCARSLSGARDTPLSSSYPSKYYSLRSVDTCAD